MKPFKSLFIAAAFIILTAATCGPDINPEPVPPAPDYDFKYRDGSTTKSFSFMEYERLFDVYLNGDRYAPTVEVPESASSWVDVKTFAGRIRIHLLDNNGDQQRTAEITIKMQNANRDLPLKITQVGAKMKGSMRYGLMALYNATNGPEWNYKEGWNTDKPLDDWHGVDALTTASYNDKKVYYGDVDLWKLDLSWCSVKGVVPEEFWDICKMFSTIDLSVAKTGSLDGSVLPDRIWHDALVTLNLERTGIKVSLNSSIANAYNLRELYLSYCKINGPIPSSLIKLTNLKVLNLEDAGLNGTIPSNIDGLKNLEELDLSANLELNGSFPESIYNLTRLKKIDLAATKVSGTLSPKIEKLQELEILYIGITNMRGNIPEEIGLLNNLFGNNGDFTYAGGHFTNIPEAERFVHSYNGDWWSWGYLVDMYQFKEGIYCTPEILHEPYRNLQDKMITLPMPKWYKERYGIRCCEVGYTYRSEENHNNPIYNPTYPYANDLQYPADEYYFDETISAWTHPKYNGKAAKHYHKVNGEWTYDENFDWNSPAEQEPIGDDDWVIRV